MKEKLNRLRTRLEVREDGGPDGIECRDETIRMLEREIATHHSQYRQWVDAMCERDEKIDGLRAEVEALGLIRCPDGRMHRWDGDGMCKECGNYATDLIDAALRGEGEK